MMYIEYNVIVRTLISLDKTAFREGSSLVNKYNISLVKFYYFLHFDWIKSSHFHWVNFVQLQSTLGFSNYFISKLQKLNFFTQHYRYKLIMKFKKKKSVIKPQLRVAKCSHETAI